MIFSSPSRQRIYEFNHLCASVLRIHHFHGEKFLQKINSNVVLYKIIILITTIRIISNILHGSCCRLLQGVKWMGWSGVTQDEEEEDEEEEEDLQQQSQSGSRWWRKLRRQRAHSLRSSSRSAHFCWRRQIVWVPYASIYPKYINSNFWDFWDFWDFGTLNQLGGGD